MRSMKKLFGISLVVVMVVMGLFSSSGAWLSDKEASANNSLTAATLDLLTNNANGTSQSYVLGNLAPGAWDLAGQVILKNNGSIPGKLWFEIVNARNFENNCIDPEIKWGDTSCGTGADQGELGAFVKASFQGNPDGGPYPRFGGTDVINASIGQRVDVMELAAGQSYPIVLYAVWTSTDNDNLAQGDTVMFDVVWHLDQVH